MGVLFGCFALKNGGPRFTWGLFHLGPSLFQKSTYEDVLFGALHAAALADDVTRILEELDGGADPRARDSKGRVPYYLCTTQAKRPGGKATP